MKAHVFLHIIISDHLCNTTIAKVQVTNLSSHQNTGELYCAGNAANFPLVSRINDARPQSSWRKAKVSFVACVGPSASVQVDFCEISLFWILTEICRQFRFWLKSATGIDTSHKDIRTFLIISLSEFSLFAIGYELRPKKETT
jgi:hypothetical protein